MADGARVKRSGRSDWLQYGVALIEEEGNVTLESLCQRAQKTRGSFYHHFESMEGFWTALMEEWRQDSSLYLIRKVEAATSHRLELLDLLTDKLNHRFECALRALSWKHAHIDHCVREIDAMREAFLVSLMQKEWKLPPDLAEPAAKMIYSLYLAAQIREPDRVSHYSQNAIRLLANLLRQS